VDRDLLLVCVQKDLHGGDGRSRGPKKEGVPGGSLQVGVLDSRLKKKEKPVLRTVGPHGIEPPAHVRSSSRVVSPKRRSQKIPDGKRGGKKPHRRKPFLSHPERPGPEFVQKIALHKIVQEDLVKVFRGGCLGNLFPAIPHHGGRNPGPVYPEDQLVPRRSGEVLRCRRAARGVPKGHGPDLGGPHGGVGSPGDGFPVQVHPGKNVYQVQGKGGGPGPSSGFQDLPIRGRGRLEGRSQPFSRKLGKACGKG